MHPEEYLDLVDENDEVIGTRLRSEIYAEGLMNFRVINAFLKNSKGELWIPRRTAQKAIYPLALDFSVSGHVSSGETYEEAFAKEVKEEINLDVSAVLWREVGYLTPKEGFRNYLKLFEIQSDETPVFNQDDFIEAMWLTPEAILELHAKGEAMKGDIVTIIKRFYF